MKTVLHKASDRGFANHGWLQANHSFSFANFFDAEKIQFGALRVLNDDVIAPSMGFSTHPHDNMEIITIPLKGTLKHKDSMGNQWETIKAGEVQVMSAGSGLLHSEMNANTDEYLSLFQIWIIPNKRNVEPRYDQQFFKAEDRQGQLQTLVTSIDTNDQGLKIHQDAKLSRIDLNQEQKFTYNTKTLKHGTYVMVISGEVEINEKTLKTRDAIGVSNTKSFNVITNLNSQLLFIEVPMS
ncbi:pirin family protein [Olleya aquimaris]|uniref:Pirin family protein n=1 Tax=Olleya sediminilitoris TaxID=2795739 RepID=A0ABS1WI76_9FLAO|nr:pirin family protein [Olleya sediminilitoris]AXO79414.1 pirin family protein [Olleya aquimaris]MBL7558821.1 pirin family protein [Olleya sediminilitoris]